MIWKVWDEPYAIGLLPNSVEVRVLDASGSMKDTFIQTLSDIQKARHLVRSKKGLLFAASVSQLYCIRGVDVQKQCQTLLQQKKFQLALQLTVKYPLPIWYADWMISFNCCGLFFWIQISLYRKYPMKIQKKNWRKSISFKRDMQSIYFPINVSKSQCGNSSSWKRIRVKW